MARPIFTILFFFICLIQASDANTQYLFPVEETICSSLNERPDEEVCKNWRTAMHVRKHSQVKCIAKMHRPQEGFHPQWSCTPTQVSAPDIKVKYEVITENNKYMLMVFVLDNNDENEQPVSLLIFIMILMMICCAPAQQRVHY